MCVKFIEDIGPEDMELIKDLAHIIQRTIHFWITMIVIQTKALKLR
jgi:hypothetical protein